MLGRMTACHDGLPRVEELVSYREFAHRLHGVSLNALVAQVRAGLFPPPQTWRGRGGQAQWRRSDVDRALTAIRVETYDGEPVGPMGDP